MTDTPNPPQPGLAANASALKIIDSLQNSMSRSLIVFMARHLAQQDPAFAAELDKFFGVWLDLTTADMTKAYEAAKERFSTTEGGDGMMRVQNMLFEQQQAAASNVATSTRKLTLG